MLPSVIVPPDSSCHVSGDRQLTLDDWQRMLEAEPRPPERPRREATSVDTRNCVPKMATELLETPDALLTRTRLRELGLERRAVDAVFRALPVVALPGYSRPMIRAHDYLQLVEQYTYRDNRVRSMNGGVAGV